MSAVGHPLSIVLAATTILSTCTSAAAECEPALFAEGTPQADAQASSDDGIEVWGLFYPPTLADLDGSPVVVEMSSPEGEGHTKVVWRATGNGQFAVDARGPDGVRIGPVWIQEHIGSNWSRPGGEWDTGWDFPEPGCWTFTITRDDDEAEISIEVLPAG